MHFSRSAPYGQHVRGGQQLTTGDQAKVYADHFIANHLKAMGGGKTYAELSGEALARPDDPELAATVQLMFRGETSRGLLLLTGTTVAGLMSRAGRVARTAGTGTRDLAKTVRSGRSTSSSHVHARRFLTRPSTVKRHAARSSVGTVK